MEKERSKAEWLDKSDIRQSLSEVNLLYGLCSNIQGLSLLHFYNSYFPRIRTAQCPRIRHRDQDGVIALLGAIHWREFFHPANKVSVCCFMQHLRASRLNSSFAILERLALKRIGCRWKVGFPVFGWYIVNVR